MFGKKAAYLAAMAALAVSGAASAITTDGTVNVDATLQTACEVSTSSAAIAFGTFNALESTGDKTASLSGFQVACSSDAAPKIWSADVRKMVNGTTELPFNLSLNNPASADDLPTAKPLTGNLSLVQDGSLHDVTLYAKVLAADFKALPSGTYSANITVSVDY